jgi:hypothetical protein
MIRQYIGLLGKGKTLNMLMDAYPFLLREDIKIVSNQPIRVFKGKNQVRDIKSTTGDKLKEAFLYGFNTLYLIDEANIVFPNYNAQSLSESLRAKFAYTRKYGNAILYTSQSFSHTHKRLRDLTNEVCKMQRYYNWLIPHQAVYYDPDFFELKGIPSPEQTKPFIVRHKYIWRWQVNKIFNSFDTTHVSIDTISGSGIDVHFEDPQKLGVKLNNFIGL